MSVDVHPINQISVLVAEDDGNMRAALAAIIDGEPDMRLAASVADATEAVRSAAEHQPHVALMDVSMPGGGGAHATREIRRRVPACRVVALSAAFDRGTVLEMLEAGAIGYVVKGGAIDEVSAAIRNAAQGVSILSAAIVGDVVDELAAKLKERRRHERRVAARLARIRDLVDDEARRSVVLQPICCLRTGKPVGHEALIRFSGRPVRPPDQWFRMAHSVGLGLELERAALRSALARVGELPSGTYLSVNGSPEVFAEQETHELLAQADGAHIVLEITEHAPVADYGQLAARLGVLRGRGARLAVDDAGAGFASLRHILQLSPDFIKLDRSLVAGIAADPARQALADGLISFGTRIGVNIVAEGIEQPEELRVLRDRGVRFGQGYLLARPGPDPVHTAVSVPA